MRWSKLTANLVGSMSCAFAASCAAAPPAPKTTAASRSAPPPARPATIEKALPSLAGLVVLVTPSRRDGTQADFAFAAALGDALRASGVTVAKDACDPYDVALGVRLSGSDDGSITWHAEFRGGMSCGSDDTSFSWSDRASRIPPGHQVEEQRLQDRWDAVLRECRYHGEGTFGSEGFWFRGSGGDADAARELANAFVTCPALGNLESYLAELKLRAVDTPSAANAVASAPPAAPAPSGDSSSAPPPLSAFVAASPQPGNYAFVVGVEHYRDVPAATGARSDADTFAELARRTFGLKDDHVRVATEEHATRTDVLEGLKWLRDNVTAGGRVYFYFSGHGAPATDASTYLLPYDGDPRDVAGTAVAMSDVMAQLGQTRAREVLAIVDSCFSGAGGRSVLPPGARPLMRVKDAVPATQMALFTASQGDEISGSAPGGGGGLFTKWVTTGLGTGQADTNGDGQIALQELSDWVSPRVARDANADHRQQHPRLVVGNGVGDAASFVVEYGLSTK